MTGSLLMTASAGSGKTYHLTGLVRRLIADDPALIVAVTFTTAAAAEMEKRILEKITGEKGTAAEKLRLLMRAAQVRYSTIDALFHQFLATEESSPQMADEHEKKIIDALAAERFFTHPRVIADTAEILIAARILKIKPEDLSHELDRNREALAAWECPPTYLAELKGNQTRITTAYDTLREQVAAVAPETEGSNLHKQVTAHLLKPIEAMPSGKLFEQDDIDQVGTGRGGIKDEHRTTAAYARLQELFPEMRRLVAEYILNTARLRSALLKRFSALRAELVEEEKRRLDRRYFDDVPRELIALDGEESPDRPELMARLYERGYHRTAHLLLDEFQDTSARQMELLRPLMEDIAGDIGEPGAGARSLFFVGDWKQSIYRWRGAEPERLQRWLAPLIRSGQLPTGRLPYNWRSTPLLIEFFNQLTKELFAGSKSADDRQDEPPEEERKKPYAGPSSVAVIPVACERGDDQLYERIVAEIRQRQRETGCAWGDITVLCRTHGHIEKVAKGLARPGEHGEAPVGTSDLAGRELLSLREGTALFIALATIFGGNDERFTGRALAALGFGDLSDTVRDLAKQTAARLTPLRFGAVAAALRDLAPHFPRSVIETVWDEAERYFDRPEAADAETLLRYLLAVGNLVTVPEGEHADRVKLATMHSAKGLEFPHLFVLWKDGRDPNEPVIDPDDGCPLDLSGTKLDFLATGPMAGAAAIAEAAEGVHGTKAADTANLLYVAATRAKQSLTIVVRANKEGELKGFGERMERAAREPLAGFEKSAYGHRHDYGPARATPPDHEELTPVTLAPGTGTPEAAHIDPTLRSADIEAGIERGIRIHAALAKLSPKLEIPEQAAITDEERRALNRFLRHAAVRELLTRPGRTLCEQHLSDTTAFGVVDRLIVAPDRITLIDYKTGPRRSDLTDKYRAQMERYRAILGRLYPERTIESFLLFIDEKEPVTPGKERASF